MKGYLKPLTLFFSFLTFLSCGRSGEVGVIFGVRVSERTVDTGDVGLFLDMEVDPNSAPGIAYYDLPNGDLKYAHLNLSSGKWDIAVVDQDGDVGGMPNLSFDSLGNPNILYHDFTHKELKYAYFNGVDWIVRRVEFPGEMEGYPGMVIDRNEVAHISAVSRGRYNLLYIVFVPDPFNPEIFGMDVDEGLLATGRGGNINLYTTLLLRERFNRQLPVILYYNASEGMLQLAYLDFPSEGFQSANWYIRVLDGTTDPGDDDVGLYLSGTLENSDTLHVAYFNLTRQNLLYGRYTFSTDTFTKEIVETEGVVGESTSITLDGRNRPVISYYDATNHQIKVAVKDRNRWKSYPIAFRGILGGDTKIRWLPRQGVLGVAFRDHARGALKFAYVEVK